MISKKSKMTGVESSKDVVAFLREKYGESLSRTHIDEIDVTSLNANDKESIRKLKISIANKGRRPWNVGKHHRPDTIEKIREKTRQAMGRVDVRKRWEANWKPKPHSRREIYFINSEN
jgi:hypothetical protein